MSSGYYEDGASVVIHRRQTLWEMLVNGLKYDIYIMADCQLVIEPGHEPRTNGGSACFQLKCIVKVIVAGRANKLARKQICRSEMTVAGLFPLLCSPQRLPQILLLLGRLI